MARNPEHNRAMREQAQEKIRYAAAVLFAERGYERATISEIAQRAGVARGLVSYYFPSKDALLVSLYTVASERWITDVEHRLAAFPRHGAPARVLAELLDTFLLPLHPEWEVNWRLWVIRLQPAVKTVLAAHGVPRAYFVDRWRDALQELGYADPDMERLRLTAAVQGALLRYQDDPDGFPLQQFAAYLRKSYCGSAAPASLLSHA